MRAMAARLSFCVSFGTPLWVGTRARIASTCAGVRSMFWHQLDRVPFGIGMILRISP
jgi:hypothetical protein